MTIKKALVLSLLIPVGLSLTGFASAQQGPQSPDRPAFADIDTDGNGELTLEELQNLGAARFAANDIDGDGALSRDELLAAGQERMASRADRMLERLDTDEDGMISQEEMAAAQEGRGGRRSPERMFERVDADEDGVISQAEFEEAAERMMERRGGRHGQRGDRG